MKKCFSFFASACVMAMMFLTSCGPYKTPKYFDIGTNQTAFVIPMEQGNKDGQQMFKSIEYLEKKKVAAKRVYVEQLEISTGRGWWDYKWLPTDTVVIVHRAPVTREWTKKGDKEPTQTHVLNVESKESIGFDVPVNCTGSVLEEDASTFLYHFGGQTIEWVMDHNVRPYILDFLTIEFGRYTMEECQNNRNKIYEEMKKKTTEFFKAYGLTIVNLGVAGEFAYTDEEIQTAINTQFISERKVKAAQNEVDAANKFATAAEAVRKQKELDVDVKMKEALADAIRNGKLTWPNTLVIGKDADIMDIWGAKNLNNK